MAKIKLLVLDFDGTITDAEEEGQPFRDGYLDDIAVLTGKERTEIDPLAKQFEAEIAKNPQANGWIFSGKIVAPASVDPYLRIMPIARKILDHYDAFTNEQDRTRLLDGILFKYNYQKTTIAFKPGAAEVLLSLEQSDVNLYIVTNSHTKPVQKKVQTLHEQLEGNGSLLGLVDRVHGRAQKYVLDQTFDQLPEKLELSNLERPIFLRRRFYFEVLEKLRKKVGATWEEVQVVGDIFELDLALPFKMGAQVALMVNEFTPEYEKEFLKSHQRGQLVHSVSEILGLLS